MENETEVIKHQMEETRTALSEKLEAVEELVASTVKETTQTVSDTVAAVTDKVENTVNTVTDTVSESVEAVKQALDVTGYVERYPWLAVGGGVALGYALGSLLGPSGSVCPTSWTGSYDSHAESALPPASSGGTSYGGRTTQASEAASTGGRTSSFLDAWQPLIDKLKGLAIGTVTGLVGEMVVKNLPDNLKSEVSNMLDETTRNLGGTILRHQ